MFRAQPARRGCCYPGRPHGSATLRGRVWPALVEQAVEQVVVHRRPLPKRDVGSTLDRAAGYGDRTAAPRLVDRLGVALAAGRVDTLAQLTSWAMCSPSGRPGKALF